MSNPEKIGKNALVERGPKVVKKTATELDEHRAKKFNAKTGKMVNGVDSDGKPIVAGQPFTSANHKDEENLVYKVYKKSTRKESKWENGKVVRDENNKIVENDVEFWEKVGEEKDYDKAVALAKTL